MPANKQPTKQGSAFIAKAKELECFDNEGALDDALRMMVPRVKPKPAKKPPRKKS